MNTTEVATLELWLRNEEVIDDPLDSLVAASFVPAKGKVFCIFKWLDLQTRVLNWLADELSPPDVEESRLRTKHVRCHLVTLIHAALMHQIDSYVGRCRFSFLTDAVRLALPSGRKFFYCMLTPRICHHPPHVTAWLMTHDQKTPERSNRPDPNVVFDDLVQAICRDVMVESLIQLDEAALAIVVHGPNYIVAEAPISSAVATLTSIIADVSMQPDWAEEMCLDVEGYVTPRLGACRPNDTTALHARNGAILM